MFETFALRLAAGLVLALAVLPARDVHPRFYRIHWLIVLGLIGAVGVFAWDAADDWFWLPFGVAVMSGVIGFWCWAVEELRFARLPVLLLGFSALIASLMVHNASLVQLGRHVTAAGVLGLTTTAMLMGHWYLISPTMSLAPLMRLLQAMFVALAVRMPAMGLDLWLMSVHGGLDETAWLWTGLRVVTGLVGPAALGWMAWQSARIRATQSATGILYVAVIFVFIGEATDLLLQGHLAEVAS